MKQLIKHNLFFIFLISNSLNAFSSKDVIVERKFGNVSVRIFTSSFYYEEINKALILGNLFNDFLTSKQIVGSIYLDFTHKNEDTTRYFLSYNQGDKIINGIRSFSYNDKGLVIKVEARYLNMPELIKLFFWSINNLDTINKTQKFISFTDNYQIECLNNSLIENIVNQEFNTEDFYILSNEKIYTQNNIDYNLGYYFYKNNYYFYDLKEKELESAFNLSNIYQIIDIDNNNTLIFESDSTFYFFSVKEKKLSKCQSLIKLNTLYQYNVVLVDTSIFIFIDINGTYKFFQYNIKQDDLLLVENINREIIYAFSNFHYRHKNCIRF